VVAPKYLYRVKISHLDYQNLLDLVKPICEQSDSVKKIASQLQKAPSFTDRDTSYQDRSGEILYSAAREIEGGKFPLIDSDLAAIRCLLANKIRGAKYDDGSGECFVLYDKTLFQKLKCREIKNPKFLKWSACIFLI
jgi:hypothetical protein